MTSSFGDDYEQLENCGVDFDHTCFGGEGYASEIYGEDIGECEEDDQRCISQYLLQRKRLSIAQSKNTLKTTNIKDGKSEGDTISRRISSLSKNVPRSPTLLPSVPHDAGYFEGLPNDYYKKQFRPDYPIDLQMKQVCASKQARRRTLGVTRTQPKAVFIPSLTALDSQSQRSNPPSPAMGGRKSMAITINSQRTSFAPEVEKGIFMDDPSGLEENRLPPQVVSSSDEVVVDWIETHNVQMMFEYFLGLCVINQPEDPWTFISQLCGKLIDARNDIAAFDNLPRLLTPEHTEAIFRIYDRIENGFITVSQYKAAMEAMGLNRFSTNPEGWEENAISKDVFVKEATEAIDDLLRTFMVFERPSTDENGSNADIRKSKSTANQDRSYSGSGSSSYSYSGSGTVTAESPVIATANANEEEETEESPAAPLEEIVPGASEEVITLVPLQEDENPPADQLLQEENDENAPVLLQENENAAAPLEENENATVEETPPENNAPTE